VSNKYIIYIFFNVVSSFLIGYWSEIGAFLAFFNALLLVDIFTKRYGVNSYAFIFVLGYFLYGYIAPITAINDEKFSFFSYTNFRTSEFIIVNNLAGLGLVVASLLKHNDENNNKLSFTSETIWYAIGFALIASFGEIVNIIRAGGFSLIGSGKAVYQDAVSSLFLTIPSIFFGNIASCFFAFYLSREGKKSVYKIVLFALTISIIVILFLAIGRRGALVQFFLAFLLSYNINKKIRKISFIAIIIFAIGLSASSLVFATRGMLGLAIKEGKTGILIDYVKKDKRFRESFYKGLNPAYSEFAAPLLNYSIHRNKQHTDFYKPYGVSYFNAIFVDPYPRWLLPYKKPQSISLKFRDSYFKGLGKKSRIAGSAFSSILESYLNFGYFGVLFMYFIFGLALNMIEYLRRNSTFYIAYLILIGTTAGTALRFHRSPLASTTGNFMYNIVVLAIFAFFLLFFFNLKLFFSKNND